MKKLRKQADLLVLTSNLAVAAQGFIKYVKEIAPIEKTEPRYQRLRSAIVQAQGEVALRRMAAELTNVDGRE